MGSYWGAAIIILVFIALIVNEIIKTNKTIKVEQEKRIIRKKNFKERIANGLKDGTIFPCSASVRPCGYTGETFCKQECSDCPANLNLWSKEERDKVKVLEMNYDYYVNENGVVTKYNKGENNA
jgi:hypothetical protein